MSGAEGEARPRDHPDEVRRLLLEVRRSNDLTNPVVPVRLAIDASSDGRRAAYAALIVDHGVKPRLIYGVGRGIPTATVEAWGVDRALLRVNGLLTRGSCHVQYRWISRSSRLIRHLHNAANLLRRSLWPCPRRMPVPRDFT